MVQAGMILGRFPSAFIGDKTESRIFVSITNTKYRREATLRGVTISQACADSIC